MSKLFITKGTDAQEMRFGISSSRVDAVTPQVKLHLGMPTCHVGLGYPLLCFQSSSFLIHQGKQLMVQVLGSLLLRWD